MTEAEIVPRLFVAAGIGAGVGFERQVRHKVAGLRTHTLVALACSLVMSVSALLHNQVPIATGILTGVGFIGAGTVIRTEATVTGITTAGTIWMVAALGMTVGAGFYLIALVSAALTLATLDVLGRLEHLGTVDTVIHEITDLTEFGARLAHLTEAHAPPPPDSPAPAAPAAPPDTVARRHPWWRRWLIWHETPRP